LRRDNGLTYKELGIWLNSIGIEIRSTSLNRIYNREKIKLLKELNK
jgi:hypothetical protein